MVENFGSYLKHERELRGVSLEEISGATNIHIRYLQALEDNKFDEIPGEVFIKGYIRSYAVNIGADVEEMQNIYKESSAKKIEKKLESKTPYKISAKNFLSYSLIGLIILAMIFGVKYFTRSIKNPPVKNAELNEKQNAELPALLLIQDLKEKTSVTVEGKLSKNSEVTVPKQSKIMITKLDSFKQNPDIESQVNSLVPRNKKRQPVLEKPLKLTIKVKNNSWFNMTIDNFREEDFIIPADGEKSFWANEVFRLNIGNKQGTDITLNGKLLVFPESQENLVKDFIIDSKLID